MLTLKESDGMNVMISSILDIGRTEGAQFEQAKNIDLVEFIKYKTNDYNMLAAKKSITIKFSSNVSSLQMMIQETLFNQILWLRLKTNPPILLIGKSLLMTPVIPNGNWAIIMNH